MDRALAELLPDYSRNRIIAWLKAGDILVDGGTCPPARKVVGGESVVLQVTPVESETIQPQAMDINIIAEDADFFVINKPAGLVVHPGAGNPDGTLLNGLLHLAPELEALPRLGLIHRLDKDTSGLLVVARSELAHRRLTEDMQQRLIEREYLAVVNRVMTSGGSINAPIARHKTDRKRMAVKNQSDRARHAVTHYTIVERYRSHTLVRVKLETGRTHQIRVHMEHIHHPVVGDPVYGRNVRMSPLTNIESEKIVRAFNRQALHAARLRFRHPVHEEWQTFEAKLPDDMQALIQALQVDAEIRGDP